MEIVSLEEKDLSEFGAEKDVGTVFFALVKVTDVEEQARLILKEINDTSWISSFDQIDQIALEAKSKKTIKELTSRFLDKIQDSVTSDFGEYLITFSARFVLSNSFQHTLLPLTELIKEKISGNPGFDFHSESTNNIIIFGEAKYNATNTSYGAALEQICDFISDAKDDAELDLIRKFVSDASLDSYQKDKKGYVASFSIHGKNPLNILKNTEQNQHFQELLIYPELYLVGVVVDAA